MIQLSHIEKTYDSPSGPVKALKGIDLTIERGEIFGIIGLSGAGKSTLIRCINMLERPTAGKVIVDGQDMTAMSEKELRKARKNIGMIFQHFNLLSSATVYDNIAFPLRLSHTPEEEIKKKVLPLLDLVGLADKAHQYPSQLSGGQKQRVGIARALASEPKVLLCDEATSALDPQTTRSILELIQDINRKLSLTVVVITHEMQVIKDIFHKVAVIENGVDCGPRAYLRPGTHMLAGSKAGTHVEIKKSTIGEGSKVPHLSYIGDTTMGSGVNVGAGSITCNYDGVHKHKTVIGKDAFIGSDTMMVAPAQIGDGALVAAGSVITEPVPADALGLGRARQVNIEGWAADYRRRLHEDDEV